MFVTKLVAILGDITEQSVDAIVNAANNSLCGGGGVDGAIHKAAGPKLLAECLTLNGCPTGEAKITRAYNLPAKYVIHTVGPVYGKCNGYEPALLANCYLNSLKLAQSYNLKTVAFPAISTGVYGYPKLVAAQIAINTVRAFLQQSDSFTEIRFVLYKSEDLQIYQQILSN